MEETSRIVGPMSDAPTTVRELIDLWPSRRELADDIGTTVERVQKWARFQSIPAKYHLAVLEAAERRGLAVTADLIVRLHAPAGEEAA